MTKVCERCKRELDLTAFPPSKRLKRVGHTRVCADCKRALRRAAEKRFRDKHRIEFNRKRSEHRRTVAGQLNQRHYAWLAGHPEQKAIYKARADLKRRTTKNTGVGTGKYLRTKPRKTEEERKATQLIWREANKDRIRALWRNWEKDNKDKRRIHAQVQTAKRRASGTLKAKDWIAIKQKYGYRCLRCLRPESAKRILTIDHVRAISRGGATITENIQPLCLRCNLLKGTRSIDYRGYYDWDGMRTAANEFIAIKQNIGGGLSFGPTISMASSAHALAT